MSKLTTPVISIISIIILASCTHESNSKSDLLDKVKSDSKLIRDLKDVYRAFHVFHKISEFQEIIRIQLSDLNHKDSIPMDSFKSDTVNVYAEAYIKKKTEALIFICENLQGIEISDDRVRSDVDSFISSTIRNARLLIEKGYKTIDFIADDTIYLKQSENFFFTISNAFSIDRFTKLTDEKYWIIIDKKNYIRQEQYAEYNKTVEVDLMAGLSILERLTKTSKNFQESSIYQIEIADQFVKKDSLISAGRSIIDSKIIRHLAAQKYHALLNKQVYSLYLFEAWLKWRTAIQADYGFSKYSDIPNEEYEQQREKAALVVLEYISRHQDDDMAINQFLLFATHEIVTRFGDIPSENQAGLDFDQLFYKRSD